MYVKITIRFVYTKHSYFSRKRMDYVRTNLREDADLLQKDLAQLLNCTQVCYSNYEMGKRDIPTDVLIKLANFYHTSIDYLLGETDIRTPYPKNHK